MLKFLFALIASISTFAHAFQDGELIGFSRYSSHSGIKCSPTEMNSNLHTVDTALTSLAESADFQNAHQFRAFVDKGRALQFNDKLQYYKDSVGLANKPLEHYAMFLGSRETPAATIDLVKEAYDLNTDQARLVIETVRDSLKGDLR